MKFEEGDKVQIVKDSEEFKDRLSSYGVGIGDVGEIVDNFYDDSLADYLVDIQGERLSMAADELESICLEDHQLLWHDTKEKYFCPFCTK